MSLFTDQGVTIHYEETGTGFPVLLLANGAMESTIEAWEHATINPRAVLPDEFHLVAMDQRNAGKSTGPLPADPWDTYAEDQLLLMDHLGIDRFLAMGCCIGCSFALKLAEVAPERVVAAVLEQPIGIVGQARARRSGSSDWVRELVARRDDLTEEDGERFSEGMWAGGSFVRSVTRDMVRSCAVPLLVLPGIDTAHPHEIGLEIAEIAPDAELLDPWKETPQLAAQAAIRVKEFLRRHASKEMEKG